MDIHDLVFTIGLLGTAGFLIPMIRGGFKPPLSTSIPMALILGAFTINCISLGLVLSAALEGLNTVGWLYLAIQRPSK